MRSFAYNPLALQQYSSSRSLSPLQSSTSSLQLKNPISASTRQFHHGSLSRVIFSTSLSKGRINTKFDCKRILAGWANNATIPSLLPSCLSRGRDFQCRARPDLNVDENEAEIGKPGELMNMDVAVRDGWQWTKTNQELVIN